MDTVIAVKLKSKPENSKTSSKSNVDISFSS